MKAVISSKKEILTISFVLIGLILYMVSAVMYYVENAAQPEVFSSLPFPTDPVVPIILYLVRSLAIGSWLIIGLFSLHHLHLHQKSFQNPLG